MKSRCNHEAAQRASADTQEPWDFSKLMRGLLRAEVCSFLGALWFLTRLPAPQFQSFTGEGLDRSAKYFPLVGIFVGSCCAAVFVVAAQVWTGPLPALLAVAAGVAITGAFHEDGFADFFDAMGGATREAQLAIMKDSRLGTFGVIALGFAIACKIAALSLLSWPVIGGALVAAHSGGRLAAIGAMATMPYARDPSAAKVKSLAKTNIPVFDFMIAASFGLFPLLLLPLATGLMAAITGSVVAIVIAWRAKQSLGGFTGDVLGAIEQSYEIAFFLAVAACV